ncbi:MAG: hypothetical protein ACNA7J_06500 [Wenzhouxiangella sp.]
MFTDAVIANNRNMMGLLAQIRQKEPIQDRIAALDELGFRDMLQEITDESQRAHRCSRWMTFATFVKLFGVILETLQRLATHPTREPGP